MTKTVGLIVGSTRVNRIGPQVAELIQSIIATLHDETIIIKVVDIAAFKLPTFDEPILPAMVPAHGQFQHAHSIAWDAEIRKYDGYIFLTPEWNFGVPGTTKNAIDFLYHAWIGKPVLIVSYGIKGGSHASDSLNTILNGMHLKVVETRPQLVFPGADPQNRNQSPSLLATMGGVLHDESKNAWKAESADLLKGYGELKALLEAE